jgi:predicted MFS family arabinose efflux permease
MLGLTVATLLGVPLATSFGQTLGWRAAFAAVGAIGSLAILLIWRFIPAVSADADASPLRELGALRRLQVWLTGGLTIAAGYGWTSTGWVGTLFALGGVGVFTMSLLSDGALRGRSRFPTG